MYRSVLSLESNNNRYHEKSYRKGLYQKTNVRQIKTNLVVETEKKETGIYIFSGQNNGY